MVTEIHLIYFIFLKIISSVNANIGLSLVKDFECLGEKIKSFKNEVEHERLDDIFQRHHKVNADLVVRMLENICVEKTSTNEQNEAIATFINTLLFQELKDTIQISPFEIQLISSNYACMTDGLASGLKNIKNSDLKVHENTDSQDFHIAYEIKGLHVRYGFFYFKIWPLAAKVGSLDIEFGENEIGLVFNVPNIRTLIEKLIQNECIITLKKQDLNKLEVTSTRLTDKNKEVFTRASALVGAYLKRNQAMFKSRFQVEAMREIHRALQAAGNFFCIENSSANLAESSPDNKPDSDAFKRNCGSGRE